MRVTTDIDYPGATPSAVFALIARRDFRVAVCEATHALSYEVDVTVADDGSAAVTVTRTLPAEVPDFVKSFVGQTLTIVQSERWGPPADDGGRAADLLISFTGQPVRMSGSVVLEATADGARERISGDLAVSVPFLGKRIEPEVAKAIVEAAAREEQTGRAWLTRA
jgi:hypothetical protein